MKCTVSTCNSTLVYTTYIRVMKRNEKTHRSKQQFVPVGLLCLDCHNLQFMLSGIIAFAKKRATELSDSS